MTRNVSELCEVQNQKLKNKREVTQKIQGCPKFKQVKRQINRVDKQKRLKENKRKGK